MAISKKNGKNGCLEEKITYAEFSDKLSKFQPLISNLTGTRRLIFENDEEFRVLDKEEDFCPEKIIKEVANSYDKRKEGASDSLKKLYYALEAVGRICTICQAGAEIKGYSVFPIDDVLGCLKTLTKDINEFYEQSKLYSKIKSDELKPQLGVGLYVTAVGKRDTYSVLNVLDTFVSDKKFVTEYLSKSEDISAIKKSVDSLVSKLKNDFYNAHDFILEKLGSDEVTKEILSNHIAEIKKEKEGKVPQGYA